MIPFLDSPEPFNSRASFIIRSRINLSRILVCLSLLYFLAMQLSIFGVPPTGGLLLTKKQAASRQPPYHTISNRFRQAILKENFDFFKEISGNFPRPHHLWTNKIPTAKYGGVTAGASPPAPKKSLHNTFSPAARSRSTRGKDRGAPAPQLQRAAARRARSRGSRPRISRGRRAG